MHDRNTRRGYQTLNVWSRWPGLNRRPTVYETVALPLSYIGEVGRNWYLRLGFGASPLGAVAG
jgi:hypothetical protein